MMSRADVRSAGRWPSLALSLALSLAAVEARAVEPEPSPPVLTAEEAATLLQVDAETLELMVAAGTIPARRLTLEDGTEVSRFSRDALLAWLRAPLDERDAAAAVTPAGAGADADTDASVGTGAEANVAGATLGEEPGDPTSTEVFLREQSVLSSAGERSIDIGLFYARRDGEVLIGGDDAPGLATVTSRTGLVQGVLRHGLDDATELFVRAAAERLDGRLRLSDGYVPLDGAKTRTSLSVGARRVLLEDGVGRPELILGVTGQLPTGTSSAGLGGSVSFVESLDPAVVFGSVTYDYVDGEHFDESTLLEPAHALRIDIGYALAMSERFSLNFAMEAGYRSRTSFGDTILLDDDHAGLLFGMTVKVSPSLHLQPLVSYSLSGSGSAYTIGLGIPLDVRPRR